VNSADWIHRFVMQLIRLGVQESRLELTALGALTYERLCFYRGSDIAEAEIEEASGPGTDSKI
jgi:hypothetical protein